jgi:hypothetical protein
MCKHLGNESTHTCSGFYNDHQTIYCVHCVWEKYSHREPEEVKLIDLPSLKKLTWNGELNNPELRKKHKERIVKCNMTYPIFITLDEEGKLRVVDGCHRLYKALSQGEQFIKAIVLTKKELNFCKYFT